MCMCVYVCVHIHIYVYVYMYVCMEGRPVLPSGKGTGWQPLGSGLKSRHRRFLSGRKTGGPSSSPLFLGEKKKPAQPSPPPNLSSAPHPDSSSEPTLRVTLRPAGRAGFSGPSPVPLPTKWGRLQIKSRGGSRRTLRRQVASYKKASLGE